MKTLFKLLAGGLLAASLALAIAAPAQTSQTSPRAISFAVPAACPCAQCLFDVQRVIGKFPGVSKINLSLRENRLDLNFAETKHSISELAQTLSKLDAGKNSTLLWPLPAGNDAAKTVAALQKIPGVAGVKCNEKTRLAALTFATKPAVSFAQLDDAAKGAGQ